MNFVDRSQVPVPAILLDQALKSGGAQETRRAIGFYAATRNHGKPFPFKVYSDATVKETLEQLFHAKCAYCESRYMHLHPTDVEHWRPKGEVETESGGKIKPGYYWLAATWDNLLPSCIDCNRRRYHKVGLGAGEPVLLGKKDGFPLADERKRARKPGHEQNERPLLLNPCRDQPAHFFHFPDAGEKRGLISPRSDAGSAKAARAAASIQIFALNRVKLVLERKRRCIEIQEQMQRVDEAAGRVHAARTSGQKFRETAIYERELNRLLACQDDEAPYALMARQMIFQYLERRGIRPA